MFSNTILIQPDGLSRQEITRGQITNLCTQYLVFQQLTKAGNGFAMHPSDAAVRESLSHLASRCGWHGDDDLFDSRRGSAELIDDGSNIPSRTQYLHTE